MLVKIRIFIIAVLFVLTPFQAAVANLAVNGGFETGDFSGWTLSGNTGGSGYISITASLMRSGQYAAEFGPVGSSAFLTQQIPTTAGGQYEVDFFLSNYGGTPNSFSASWNGGTLFSGSDLGGFDYTEYRFLVTATGSSAALQFSFRQDPQFFLLDDVSVNSVPVPIPAAVWLLGSGLLGLIGVRRFKK